MIDGIRVCSEALFDIDIHEIPARGEDPPSSLRLQVCAADGDHRRV